MKYQWDYKKIDPKKLTTASEMLWYLERKINYDDWRGLRLAMIKKYLPKLKKRLDPGKRAMLEMYIKRYG